VRQLAPRVITTVIKQRAGLCIFNASRTICRNAEVSVSGTQAFSPFCGLA
jgi:hypothetical protein